MLNIYYCLELVLLVLPEALVEAEPDVVEALLWLLELPEPVKSAVNLPEPLLLDEPLRPLAIELEDEPVKPVVNEPEPLLLDEPLRPLLLELLEPVKLVAAFNEPLLVDDAVLRPVLLAFDAAVALTFVDSAALLAELRAAVLPCCEALEELKPAFTPTLRDALRALLRAAFCAAACVAEFVAVVVATLFAACPKLDLPANMAAAIIIDLIRFFMVFLFV